MSADVKQYAPVIVEKLNFESADVFLLKHGVISVLEYEKFHRALQSGSLTNLDVVRQLLPRIFEKAREFYRALRDYVKDKQQDAHPTNKELLYQLPDNFVSV